MIKKSVRTTEGKLNLKIPTTLDELTIGQLALLESGTLTDIEAISILSYCPLEELYNIRNMDDIARHHAGESHIGPDSSVPDFRSVRTVNGNQV